MMMIKKDKLLDNYNQNYKNYKKNQIYNNKIFRLRHTEYNLKKKQIYNKMNSKYLS